MIKFRKKNEPIITTRELADYIISTGKVPISVYSKSSEYNYIAKNRNVLSRKIKRRKPL